jgi:hypothetical protein
MRHQRLRFWIEALLASTTALLTVLTALVPTWIEAVFHVDPDAGNGTLEVAILAGFAVATVALALGAGREWRRAAAST